MIYKIKNWIKDKWLRFKKWVITIFIGSAVLASGNTAIDLNNFNGLVIPTKDIKISQSLVHQEQKGNIFEADMPFVDQPGIKVKYDLGEPTLREKYFDKRFKNIVTKKVNFQNNDGFKIDIVLDEKPTTNKFCYTIDGYENYDFFYQPPLTPEEIKRGDKRPPEIVGSYAVYHKTLKNNKYKTGKFLHIPYPYVWEVNNKDNTKHRAKDFNYKDSQLCVTVDQNFLNNASYPVRIDPTFGFSGIPTTKYNSWELDSSKFLATESGTITSISAYLGTTTTDPYINFGIYDDNSGTIGDLIAHGTSVKNSSSIGWKTINVSASVTKNNYYWLVIQQDANDSIDDYYDHGETNQNGYVNTYNYDSWVDNPSIDYYDNYVISIYATYTSSNPDTLLDSESFESDFGDWTASGNWLRDSNGTPSGSTGPNEAWDQDYYVYVETSSGYDNTAGDTSTLTYDNGSSFDGYVTFHYNRYGADQGTLSLEGYNGSWNSIWSVTGTADSNPIWHTVSSTATTFSNYSQLRFKNVAAGGFNGDVAIDDVRIYKNASVSTSTNTQSIYFFD